MPTDVPRIAVVAAAKPIWRSRTFWFNFAVLLLAAVELRLDVLQPLLPVNVYALLAFLVPVGNTVLRTITTQPLTLGMRPPEQGPTP